MSKNKKLKNKLKNQNDFLFRRLEIQNESIQNVIESLIENYSNNHMMMHVLLDKLRP